MTTQTTVQDLVQNDLDHLIHPLYHRKAQENQVIFERGEGVWLTDVNGKRYLDGLSCLWNVNVGHGRAELAEAAAEQMRTLAFVNTYTGFANIPAVQLATRLAALAPGDLNGVFFTSGGGESNESAFKMARYYWNIQGQPEKYKIISRMDAYHGVTLAAMGATGIPQYWDRFGPPPRASSTVSLRTSIALAMATLRRRLSGRSILSRRSSSARARRASRPSLPNPFRALAASSFRRPSTFACCASSAISTTFF